MSLHVMRVGAPKHLGYTSHVGVAMFVRNLDSLHADIPEIGWRRIKDFLKSVEQGRDKDYVTPFLPDEWRGRQIDFAKSLLPKIALSRSSQLNAIEDKESEKFGPFSLRAPWSERREQVYEYFHQKEVRMTKALDYAFNKVKDMIPKHSLTPLPLDEAFNQSPKGKNLGLPYFTSDRRFEDEYFKRIKSIAAGGWKQNVYPAVLGWRGQPNGSTKKIKNRTVFMMDHAETYGSTGVIQVVLNALRSKPGFAAWNELSTVDKRVTSMIDRAKYPIMSVDFSGFDKSLPLALIHLSFELLRCWFIPSAKAQIDWMERQFLETDLVTPDGILSGRKGGVPSGSGSTNFIDSLSQILGIHAADYELGLDLLDVEVLGDDGIYLFGKEIDVDVLTAFYADTFGMQVSADKGGFSLDHVMFLQRLHERAYRINGLCRGQRSAIRTFNGICHLERLNKGLPPEFFSARAIMACENAKWHPRFRDLVKLLYHSDKFMREMDPSTIFARAGGVGKVEDVLGLRSYRYTDELPSHGLNEFFTVIELRRLRSGKRQYAA